jgi:hypothetical protein
VKKAARRFKQRILSDSIARLREGDEAKHARTQTKACFSEEDHDNIFVGAQEKQRGSLCTADIFSQEENPYPARDFARAASVSARIAGDHPHLALSASPIPSM